MMKQWKKCQTLFFGAPKSLQMVIAAMKLKDTPWKESYGQPRQHIGEGNGTPLQYSCLENPMDGGAWWAP